MKVVVVVVVGGEKGVDNGAAAAAVVMDKTAHSRVGTVSQWSTDGDRTGQDWTFADGRFGRVVTAARAVEQAALWPSRRVCIGTLTVRNEYHAWVDVAFHRRRRRKPPPSPPAISGLLRSRSKSFPT